MFCHRDVKGGITCEAQKSFFLNSKDRLLPVECLKRFMYDNDGCGSVETERRFGSQLWITFFYQPWQMYKFTADKKAILR